MLHTSTMAYVEEREFVLRFDLRCAFPDDYEGEADGYEWAKELPALTAELVQAAIATIRRREGWQVRAGNRGRPTDEEITLVVERVLGDAQSGR